MANKTDKKINLILGPGGAKGFAHIGAIKELLSNDFKIESVLGISMGAIVAWAYCISEDIEFVEELALSFNHSKVLDKVGGLISINIEELRSFLLTASDNIDYKFEDLKIPMSVIATNAFNAQIEFISEGSVIEAIIASSLAPVLHKPHHINGKYYFDGGIFANIPKEIPNTLYNEYPYVGIKVSSGRELGIKKIFDNYYEQFTKSALKIKKIELQKLFSVNANLNHMHITDFGNAKEAMIEGIKAVKGSLRDLNTFIEKNSIIQG